MDVAGVGREDLKVILDVVVVVFKQFDEALVQIAGRGVVRDVELLGIPGEVRPELLSQPAPHIEQDDAGNGHDT